MNLQQLRYVREAVRQGLNLTEAANVLFTSQPGISKQIRELEGELGIEIFVRRGKRLVALTEPGQLVVRVIDRLLDEADNLRQVGKEFADQDSGALTIATTGTQARYSLPAVVQRFRLQYPNVHLTLLQGTPTQIAEMVCGDASPPKRWTTTRTCSPCPGTPGTIARSSPTGTP
jgi:LysR family cys regulon transcriptional activator